MNANRGRSRCNHFLASFFGWLRLRKSGCECGGHACSTKSHTHCIVRACVSALTRMRRCLCMWWSEWVGARRIKVKVFGWWKTFGTLKQESTYSTESEVSWKIWPDSLAHASQERQLRSLRVLTGLLACRCFTAASFETEFETEPTAITQRKKQLGLKCRSQTPTIYPECYETVWLSTDLISRLQLTSQSVLGIWCELLSCSALCYHWPLSCPRRTASTLGRVRTAVDRGEAALSCYLGRVNEMPPTMPVATWLAWRRYVNPSIVP